MHTSGTTTAQTHNFHECGEWMYFLWKLLLVGLTLSAGRSGPCWAQIEKSFIYIDFNSTHSSFDCSFASLNINNTRIVNEWVLLYWAKHWNTWGKQLLWNLLWKRKFYDVKREQFWGLSMCLKYEVNHRLCIQLREKYT